MPNNQYIKNRASLDFQKKEVMSQILRIWQDNPNLRLGQLLINSLSIDQNGPDIFYIEDYHLLNLLNQFNKKENETIVPQITIEINR